MLHVGLEGEVAGGGWYVSCVFACVTYGVHQAGPILC